MLLPKKQMGVHWNSITIHERSDNQLVQPGIEVVMTLLLICLILLIILGWHFVFALLGGVLIIGATGIFIAITSIIIFCVSILVLISLPGAIGLVIGGIFAIWTIIAIILAPILFPILLPLFIIFAILTIRQQKIKAPPFRTLK